MAKGNRLLWLAFTDVLNAHGGYQQHMSAAFQYNLKCRPYIRPYRLLVTVSEPKTHNQRLKGDSFRVAPGAPQASVQG